MIDLNMPNGEIWVLSGWLCKHDFLPTEYDTKGFVEADLDDPKFAVNGFLLRELLECGCFHKRGGSDEVD